MTIAVFTQPGKTDGRTVYYFILVRLALCFWGLKAVDGVLTLGCG